MLDLQRRIIWHIKQPSSSDELPLSYTNSSSTDKWWIAARNHFSLQGKLVCRLSEQLAMYAIWNKKRGFSGNNHFLRCFCRKNWSKRGDKWETEDGRIHIGTHPLNGTELLTSEQLPPLRTSFQNGLKMLSIVRSYLLPAARLYLLGLKVLLVQLFSKTFRLPGQ